VRVLETSQFEIGDGFESWFRQHGDFLRFLEVWPAVSTFRDVVFSYQSGKLDNSDLPSGFVFVKLATADLKVDFPVDSLSFTEEYMTPFLLTLYWCRAKLEFEIPTQERSIELLNGKFRGLLTQRLSIWERFTRLMRRRSSILASIIALYNETVDVGNSFETFALGELKRLGEMQGSYHLKSSNMPQSRPLEVAGFKVDILNDITKSVRFISDEANSLKGLRRKVRSLTSQYKSYSEFALQKDMMRLTKGALFIGLASLLIALLALLLRVF